MKLCVRMIDHILPSYLNYESLKVYKVIHKILKPLACVLKCDSSTGEIASIGFLIMLENSLRK